MTTDQTIDGVPRELIERVTKPLTIHDDLTDRIKARDELRALLDADKVNNRQMGLMQFVDAHPIKPAAQGQGEPVAWGFVNEDGEPDATARWDVAKHLPGDVKPLYAKQPAPVAVTPKLEMAHIVRAHMEIPGFPVLTSNKCYELAMKLNACLDEVKRLNK